jgi:hypothetical protein
LRGSVANACRAICQPNGPPWFGSNHYATIVRCRRYSNARPKITVGEASSNWDNKRSGRSIPQTAKAQRMPYQDRDIERRRSRVEDKGFSEAGYWGLTEPQVVYDSS